MEILKNIAADDAYTPPPMPVGPTASETVIGAGVAGAALGGVLTDVASVGLTGELLTDAAVLGAGAGRRRDRACQKTKLKALNSHAAGT